MRHWLEAEELPRCEHCPALADERSFMCEDCAGEADEEVQALRDWLQKAEEALRDIVKVDPVDAALDPQRPLRIAEAWLRELDAPETPEQRHYRELHDGTLTVIPPGGDPREQAA